MQNYPFARGKAYFFCNYTFDNRANNRPGAQLDIEPLSRSLERWNFEVHRGDANGFNNLSSEQLEEKLRQISRTNFDPYDCLVIILSSHGAKDVILGVDGSVSRLDDLFSLFNPIQCNSLRNKPKLFFVQACRGGDNEITVQSDGNRITLNQDFFFAYSTVENHVSFRDPTKGSWFLQCLAENFSSPQIMSNHNLTDLLTKVNCDIIDRYSSQRIAQCCSYISQLKKGFKFTNVGVVSTTSPQIAVNNQVTINNQGSVRDKNPPPSIAPKKCRRCFETYTDINTPCRFHNGSPATDVNMEKRFWLWSCCSPGFPLPAVYLFKTKPGIRRDYVRSDDDLLKVNGEFVYDQSTGCYTLAYHYA